jgi:hypothetical protein
MPERAIALDAADRVLAPEALAAAISGAFERPSLNED